MVRDASNFCLVIPHLLPTAARFLFESHSNPNVITIAMPFRRIDPPGCQLAALRMAQSQSLTKIRQLTVPAQTNAGQIAATKPRCNVSRSGWRLIEELYSISMLHSWW
jgi:hypothetical protein